jgi:hypothetical protein
LRNFFYFIGFHGIGIKEGAAAMVPLHLLLGF